MILKITQFSVTKSQNWNWLILWCFKNELISILIWNCFENLCSLGWHGLSLECRCEPHSLTPHCSERAGDWPVNTLTLSLSSCIYVFMAQWAVSSMRRRLFGGHGSWQACFWRLCFAPSYFSPSPSSSSPLSLSFILGHHDVYTFANPQGPAMICLSLQTPSEKSEPRGHGFKLLKPWAKTPFFTEIVSLRRFLTEIESWVRHRHWYPWLSVLESMSNHVGTTHTAS